jgi:hypothetical protein
MIRISVGELRALLREARYPDEFTTCRGRSVAYGSPDHIQDLEDTMERMKSARSRQKRGSAGKTDYTRAISRLKTELQRVKRYAEKLQEKEEQ